ncbi:uncharacterized protein DEA37_0000604 [Paragonimus westermani]|uniref:Uncharacterized protein n=1 Tax=Paragonimus westermani TaxID=34504 RepID=A0A5J4P304_9TREM|nr:uncharacterized protein DEA37_0000604 [Paragonimus westermani]
MSQTNENADSLAALGTSIHLNEEDWLQLLQKLTPSSIDNLQQTLKRIQQRDAVAANSEKLTFLNTASQLCGSSLLSPPVSESNVFASQSAPIVMSLGVAKATVPSMITVPSVLNVTKTVPTAMQNTIILPPSALLIAPSGPGQSVSIDSCVPVSGINRLVVTGGGLVNAPTTSTVNSTLTSDSLNSLNTLANAAVAVAANATSQAQWSSSLLGTCKPTSSADTVRFSSGSSSSESPIRTVATAVNSLISGRTTSVDGLITSICNLQSSELTSQFLPTVGATGLTVYPLQVSANGPTLFLAASPTSKSGTLAHSLGIVSTSSVQASHCNTITTPNSAGVSQSTSCTSTTPSSACSSSTSFLAFGSIPIHPGSLQTPVISGNLTNTSSTTTVVVSPSPGLVTSTPRNKPKFKALWETSLQTDVDRGVNNINTVQVNTDCLGSTDSNVKSRPISTECVPLSPQVISHSPILRASQQHSPMLGVKSIGQTPKRLAATAASLSDDRKSPNQSSADCSKKLLLVCSQAKPTISGGETSIVVAESALSKALQPSPVSLRIGNVRTESADSNLSTIISASDSKPGHSAPPLLAPVTAVMKELRSAPITTGSEHDMMSATLGTRVESLLRKSFEGSRRTFKEEPKFTGVATMKLPQNPYSKTIWDGRMFTRLDAECDDRKTIPSPETLLHLTTEDIFKVVRREYYVEDSTVPSVVLLTVGSPTQLWSISYLLPLPTQLTT